jgi:hypothetical protein
MSNELRTYLNDEAEIVLRPSLLADALLAVLDVHHHSFLDQYMRRTDDVAKAEYSRCDTCGNNPNGYLWCRTFEVIAEQLDITLPKASGEAATKK